jgi:hypothetical protein
MLRCLSRIVLGLLLAGLLAFSTFSSQADAKGHGTRHVHTRHYSAGHVYHSAAWYRAHHHRHHLYEVRVRNYHWQHRVFTSHHAAHTYYRWLGYRGLERRMHRRDNVWVVSARARHSHRAGVYGSMKVAHRVEVSYRARGFSAWIHTWHM